MKHLIPPVAAMACAIAMPALAQTAKPAPESSQYDRAPWWMKDSVITQTGYVFTEIPANRASFSASFQTTDDSADKAQSKAIAQTRALMQALDKLGKDAVRVTTGFSMRTLYDQYRDKNGNKIEDQRGDKINGYQVSLTSMSRCATWRNWSAPMRWCWPLRPTRRRRSISASSPIMPPIPGSTPKP